MGQETAGYTQQNGIKKEKKCSALSTLKIPLHLIYIYKGCIFSPMLFLPLLLEEIFAMFEFAQTKLCYIKER